MKKPFYCLFFSFKGGVGRTSALMNVALYLAKRKKRVLIVDLDIHAPGVDVFEVPELDTKSKKKVIPSYHPLKCYYSARVKGKKTGKISTENGEEIDEKLTPKEVEEKYIKENAGLGPSGFLEIALHWAEKDEMAEISYPEEAGTQEWTEDEEKFVFQLPKRDIGDGDILVMRAANHDLENYQEQLREFDKNFSKLDPGFTEKFKDRENKVLPGSNHGVPDFVESFKNTIDEVLEPDYVLVDSRPGAESISQFAMTWFAECAVLAFNLNPWNLKGIINVYDNLTETPLQRKHPNILLLASPIPNHAKNSKLYDGQYDTIKSKMNTARNCGMSSEGGPVEIPFADILTLRDVLITDVNPDDTATIRYGNLGRLIIAGNPNDLENQLYAAKNAGEQDRVIIAFERLFREYRTEVSLYFEYGIYLFEKMGRAEKARTQFAYALELIDENSDPQSGNKKPRSPYLLDTYRYLGKVELAMVRKAIEAWRSRKVTINKEDTEALLAKAFARIEKCKTLSKISNTSKTVKTSKTTETVKSVAISSAHADIYAMSGDYYFLMFDLERVLAPTNKVNEAYLEDSIKEYELATENNKYNHEFQLQLGLQKARLANIRAAKKEEYEAAIESFKEAFKLKSDSAEILLKYGCHELALSVNKKEVNGEHVHCLPMFTSYYPFEPDKVKVNQWDKAGFQVYVDIDRLEESVGHLSQAISHRTQDPFAYFYRGLARAIGAYERKRVHPNADNVIDEGELMEAIIDMDKATLYNPLLAASYYYSGLFQFLLESHKSRQDTGGTFQSKTEKSILFRQSFYRLEHFIDQTLEKILGETKSEDSSREPFYFDPEDIDAIEKRPYAFLKVMEKWVEYPSMVNYFNESESMLQDSEEEYFKEMIKKHCK